jgi:hypothetical protein
MEKKMPPEYIDPNSPRRQLQSVRARYNKLTQKNTIQSQCLLLEGHLSVE